MNSYNDFMNSYGHEFTYLNSYMNSYKLWIHVFFSYMNSYVSWIRIWIRVYQGSRCYNLIKKAGVCSSFNSFQKCRLTWQCWHFRTWTISGYRVASWEVLGYSLRKLYTTHQLYYMTCYISRQCNMFYRIYRKCYDP